MTLFKKFFEVIKRKRGEEGSEGGRRVYSKINSTFGSKS